jgi:hypothetical protein
MLIRIGYDIALGLPNPTAIVFLLRVHSSRESTLVAAENFRIEPRLDLEHYLDAFGNRCGRVNAPAGIAVLCHSTPKLSITLDLVAHDSSHYECVRAGSLEGKQPRLGGADGRRRRRLFQAARTPADAGVSMDRLLR